MCTAGVSRLVRTASSLSLHLESRLRFTWWPPFTPLQTCSPGLMTQNLDQDLMQATESNNTDLNLEEQISFQVNLRVSAQCNLLALIFVLSNEAGSQNHVLRESCQHFLPDNAKRHSTISYQNYLQYSHHLSSFRYNQSP
jgi:hypothetical protein